MHMEVVKHIIRARKKLKFKPSLWASKSSVLPAPTRFYKLLFQLSSLVCNLAHRASEWGKLPAQHKHLLVPDDQTEVEIFKP